MTSGCGRKVTCFKRDILWCLAAYVAAQLVLDVAVDRRHPELYDLEYGVRIRMLKERVAENPGRPLMLVVGSSRIGEGFEPEVLPVLRSPTGETALPFNFSHLAAGPIMNLVNVRRVLAAGIHPRWIVLEMAPTCLSHESASMPLTMSAAVDLVALQKYFDPWQVWGIYLRGRVNPWYKHRMGLMHEYCPSLATEASESDEVHLEPLGGDRRWLAVHAVPPEERRRRTDVVRGIYYEDLQHYRIQPTCDLATRDLLALCRKEGISVTLLMTPEGTEFRSWYSQEAREEVARYMAGLAHDFGVPVIDTREWCPDGDFTDSHHLLNAGADRYTRRLGQEVLVPLVEGRAPADQTCVQDESRASCTN
jgi:hypothetical protein